MLTSYLGAPILDFVTARDFHIWLRTHHTQSESVWLRLQNKDSDKTSLTYHEALDEALCWGWIDGQVKKVDTSPSRLQRFSPRRPRSVWSQINRDHIARLTREGRMQPSGLAVVAAAKADGRWDQAYAPPSRARIPDDLQAWVDAQSRAVRDHVAALKRSSIMAIDYRLSTAKKPETRARRLEVIKHTLSRCENLV